MDRACFRRLTSPNPSSASAHKDICHQPEQLQWFRGQVVSGPETALPTKEAIAAVAGKHHHYFREWRAKHIGQAITKALMERPEMSVHALQEVRRGVA